MLNAQNKGSEKVQIQFPLLQMAGMTIFMEINDHKSNRQNKLRSINPTHRSLRSEVTLVQEIKIRLPLQLMLQLF